MDVHVWSERYANAIFVPGSRVEVDIFATADGDVVKVDANMKDEKKKAQDIREKLLQERF